MLPVAFRAAVQGNIAQDIIPIIRLAVAFPFILPEGGYDVCIEDSHG